jgi:hypothetical protein
MAFYTSTLAPLGIINRLDYAGKDGLAGHPLVRRAASFSGCGKARLLPAPCILDSPPIPNRW